MRTPRNHFNVGVVFSDHAFGVSNRTDLPVTPEIVLSELEDFCARVRRELGKRQRPVAAVDPSEDSNTGTPTPRA